MLVPTLHYCCIADGYYWCVVDRLCFFFFFLFCRIVVCTVGLVISFLYSISVYTLLSKVMRHGCTKCLLHGPCVQECMDSCCFVLELVGVCTASENSDESVGIQLDDHTLDVGIICKCVLPAQIPILFQKAWTLSIPGTTSMIHSLPGLGRIQHYFSTQLTHTLRYLYCETSFCMQRLKKIAAKPFSQSCTVSCVWLSLLRLWVVKNFLRWRNKWKWFGARWQPYGASSKTTHLNC
jgi:hypothetical protein